MEAQALEESAKREDDPLSEHSMRLFVEQAKAIEKKFRETLEENNDLKVLASTKTTQVDQLSTRLEEKDRELEEKDIQLKERYEEMMEKDREIEQLRETVDQQDIQLKKTTLECLESSRELNSKQRKIEDLMETKALVEERFVQLMKDKSDLTFELNDVKYKINDLTLQISDLMTEVSRIEEEKGKLSEERNRLTDENNRLTEERDRIAHQRNKLARKLKKISNGSEAVDSEDEEKRILVTQVNAYSRECDKLKGQLQTQEAEHKQSLTRLQSELKDAHEQHNEEVTRLTECIDELQRKLKGCNEELSIEKDNVSKWSRKYDEETERLRKKRRNRKEKHHADNVKHCNIIDSLCEQLQQQRVHKKAPRLGPSINLIPERESTEDDHIDQLLREVDELRKARNEPRYSDSTSAYKFSSSAAVTAANELREESHAPTIQEVSSDSNHERPYDPNLACPKCGKQFREGQEQKQRRHINEFCTKR